MARTGRYQATVGEQQSDAGFAVRQLLPPGDQVLRNPRPNEVDLE